MNNYGALASVYADRARLLTKKELQTVRDIALGKDIKEIAVERNRSTHTVEKHRERAMHVLGLRKATKLVHVALAIGLIEITVPDLEVFRREPPS